MLKSHPKRVLIAMGSNASNDLKESYDLLKSWLEDKLVGMLKQYPAIAADVVKAMESWVEYLTGPKALKRFPVSEALQAQLERMDALRAAWQNKKPVVWIVQCCCKA